MLGNQKSNAATSTQPELPAEDASATTELPVQDDGSVSPSNVSAASSLYEFVQEHGRTFHKYKEGKYFLPNDQHSISKFLLKGKLGLAPIEKPGRVLDLGTGTGIWAIEFAEENPESEVLGTDLSPIQPAYLPPNCRFEIDDVDDDWAYSHRFDYIHGRYLLPFIKKDWNHYFKTIYDNLNPGGWAECQETIIYFQSIDGSHEGTALQRWNTLLLQAIQRMGRSATEALRCKTYLAEAGFANLGEKKFAVPMNPWAKGKEQKAIGSMQMQNNLEGIDGITMTVFTRALGWVPADVEKLLVDVKNDLQDRSIHAYITVSVNHGISRQSCAR
ncbi:S-adenosyl-L-methionine-dependent methyltransferase [Parathielavia appendiculata]|uniref:S-adenosyl-L-methionine-dependent methyltransferase n=1 Tax=Parathielavia appendiculata TaxID=2587402 RepID=A0AAN6TRT5_9PEZI|nr:S-adenosyl-L-methionine-dependent methyltransferase [Parathielavia appendiculata]